MDKMSRDYKFVISTLENMAKIDPFIGKHLNIYKKKYETNLHLKQPINIGLYRSDYMQNKADNKWGQIEINCCGTGGWTKASKGYELHKYILSRYGDLNINKINHEKSVNSNKLDPNKKYLHFPDDTAFDFVCNTLAVAAKLVHPSNPYILIICHKEEVGNMVIDQLAIEMKLWSDYKIPCIRKSYHKLINHCKLDSNTNELIIYEKYKISVVYSRGSIPADFPDPSEDHKSDGQDEWDVLEILQLSSAIKEPVGYFLLSSKYIQTLWYENKDILLKYLTKKEADLIYNHMFKQYTLDINKNKNLEKLILEIKNNSSKYVVKPQREGGGNNYFDNDIIKLFNKLGNDYSKYFEYIAMERIYPTEFEAWLLFENGNPYEFNKKCSAEIGIFSCYLSDGVTNYVDKVCGAYSKTRLSDATEGGICHGSGLLDSIIIVDD